MSQIEIKNNIQIKYFHFLYLSLGLLSIFFGLSTQAAIPRKSLSDQLIADFYAIKSQEVALDTAQIIPVDMQPTNNASQVFSRLADRGLSSFVNSDSFKASSLGRTTNQVQEELKTEMVVRDQSDPLATEHKINLNLQIFQAIAQMTYTGFTNLKIKYRPVKSEVNFEFSEKLDQSKDLVFDHMASSDHNFSQVSVRWIF